jgi:putative transcriptional regulator
MSKPLANMERVFYILMAGRGCFDSDLPGRRFSRNAMKNRLKVLRAERNWSQADLAERLGVSRQTVNAIEAQRYDPSLPLAFRIAKVFSLPIEQIFEGEE